MEAFDLLPCTTICRGLQGGSVAFGLADLLRLLHNIGNITIGISETYFLVGFSRVGSLGLASTWVFEHSGFVTWQMNDRIISDHEI
jgi:hypothetical protein